MIDGFEREKLILLCTIIPNSKHFLDKILNKINDNFEINNNKVFVLKTSGEDDKLILTYNVIQDGNTKYRDVIKSTFQVHRKKNDNVLYTLNALNLAIVEQAGKRDTSYKLDWSKYQNSLLLVRKSEAGGDELHRIPTLLNEIVDLTKI